MSVISKFIHKMTQKFEIVSRIGLWNQDWVLAHKILNLLHILMCRLIPLLKLNVTLLLDDQYQSCIDMLTFDEIS